MRVFERERDNKKCSGDNRGERCVSACLCVLLSSVSLSPI